MRTARLVHRVTLSFFLGDQDAGGFALSQAQTKIPASNLDGIAQRSQGDHFDLLALEKPHLHEPLYQRIVARKRRDAPALAGP